MVWKKNKKIKLFPIDRTPCKWWRHKEYKKAIKIIPKNKFRCASLTKILPYSGTDIEKEMKENKIYQGNSINFSYKINNPKINFIYNTAKGLSNIVEKIQRKMHITVASNFYDWTKRTKK